MQWYVSPVFYEPQIITGNQKACNSYALLESVISANVEEIMTHFKEQDR